MGTEFEKGGGQGEKGDDELRDGGRPARAPLRVKIVSIALRSAGRGALWEDKSQHVVTVMEGVHEACDSGRRTSNARAEKTNRVATPALLRRTFIGSDSRGTTCSIPPLECLLVTPIEITAFHRIWTYEEALGAQTVSMSDRGGGKFCRPRQMHFSAGGFWYCSRHQISVRGVAVIAITASSSVHVIHNLLSPRPLQLGPTLWSYSSIYEKFGSPCEPARHFSDLACFYILDTSATGYVLLVVRGWFCLSRSNHVIFSSFYHGVFEKKQEKEQEQEKEPEEDLQLLRHLRQTPV
ncbi:hypothetical protein C8R44DRAFT_753915 [Mycena epipterygia]|nr:hypothetical protein C8R44DRAFT_753915 [Mycena epipterygia]